MIFNVIIPLAGDGKRFKEKGIKTPKPLIKFYNKTLIETSIDSLNIKKANYYFIIKKYEQKKYNLKLINILKKYKPKKIISINKTLNGPVYTLLKVKKINRNYPLIIANCDQYMRWNINDFKNFIKAQNPDGCVLTYKSKNKKNSFVKLKNGLAIKFAEKKPISNQALIGVHYWKRTRDFFNSAKKYVKSINKNNEAYVSETYNYMLKNKKIKIYELDKKKFYLLGTPNDMERQIKNLKNEKK
jgi:NDP-sugar pyrophosphorylase family protein